MCILRIIGVTFRVVWPITSSGGGGPKFAVNCESCVKVRNENYRGSVALRTHCRIVYILLEAELRRVTVPHADLKYECAVPALSARNRRKSITSRGQRLRGEYQRPSILTPLS
jgi:hypothetical protein